MTDCFGKTDPGSLVFTIYQLMMEIIMENELPEKEQYIVIREGVDIIPSSIELSAMKLILYVL